MNKIDSIDKFYEQRKKRKRRMILQGVFFSVVIVILVALFFILKNNSKHVGDDTLHTLFELSATFLSLFVGVLALTLYYTRPTNFFLFIGVGFTGTALLHGYHMFVTSTYYDAVYVNPLDFLEPLSWNVTRFFLSFFMFGSWVASVREKKRGRKGNISSWSLYFSVVFFIAIGLGFYSLSSLPQTYFDGIFWGMPEEVISGIVFLLALMGYLIKGRWKDDFFEYWIVLFLLVSTIAQLLFKANDGIDYDALYIAEHGLILLSYTFVFISLLVELYEIYKILEEERITHLGRIFTLQGQKETLEKEAKDYREAREKVDRTTLEVEQLKETLEKEVEEKSTS